MEQELRRGSEETLGERGIRKGLPPNWAQNSPRNTPPIQHPAEQEPNAPSDAAIENHPAKEHGEPEQPVSDFSPDLENNPAKDPTSHTAPSLFSPHLKDERKLLLKSIVRVEVVMVVIILGILSIYWGGLASLLPNQRVLTVAIVDFDQQEVGPAFTQFGNRHQWY
jgi:hypothetical protein